MPSPPLRQLATLSASVLLAAGCTSMVEGGGDLAGAFASADTGGFAVLDTSGFPTASPDTLTSGGQDPTGAPADPGTATDAAAPLDPGHGGLLDQSSPGDHSGGLAYGATPGPDLAGAADPGATLAGDPGLVADPGDGGGGGLADAPLDPGPQDTWAEQDDDLDGIPNGVEGTGDPDGDGAPNYQDADSDGDGLPDIVEAGPQGTGEAWPRNSDGSGGPDFLDDDADDDGVPDAEEMKGADGVPGTGDETDPTKADTDGDGYTDLVEVAYGSDATDPNSTLPPEAFYVVLPFQAPDHEYRPLDFGTDISYADVLIMVDLSGSMAGEHANLKTGIKDTIIDGVLAEIPGAAFGLVKFGTWSDQPYQVTQPITTNAAAVQTAVDSISTCGGADEPHAEALYQAAAGTGMNGKLCLDWFIFCLDSQTVSLPPASCPAGTVGGACFRDLALPIFLMITDEGFATWDWDSGNAHGIGAAINAMQAIGAKFIGVDSSGGNAAGDFNQVATGTGSVNQAGQPFNFTISSDGTGLSGAIVDAVTDLTQNIKLGAVTTTTASVANPEGVDTTQFIKAIKPLSAAPPSGADSFDATSFYGLDPGTTVTFEVDFHNDFFQPTSDGVALFESTITVLGDGTQLDTRPVYIIVPSRSGAGT
jgi:hypothetical protein